MTLENLPQFDMTAIRPFYDAVDESALPNVDLRLTEGRRLTRTQARRHTAILDKSRKAAELLGTLPGPLESTHCILKGDFALWDFVPAILQITGQAIDELIVATLGFSKKNIEALSQLVTASQIKRVSILCSHYFAAQDSEIYQHAAEFCGRHNFPLVAMRTHAKVLLLTVGEHRLVIESSANLRSCHNCEQATIFNDPGVHAFHKTWMQELFSKGMHDERP